jgi:hypothetical protein
MSAAGLRAGVWANGYEAADETINNSVPQRPAIYLTLNVIAAVVLLYECVIRFGNVARPNLNFGPIIEIVPSSYFGALVGF